MALQLIHCDLSLVNSSNEDINVCPQIDGADILISASPYGSGSTAQTLCNNLTNIAFDKEFRGLDDSKSYGDIHNVLSINKITEIYNNSKTNLNDLKLEYAGWFNTN